MDEISNILEALLFVAGEPLAIDEISMSLGKSYDEIHKVLLTLQQYYSDNKRGIQLRFINEKAQLCSNSLYSTYIEALLQPEKNKSFSQSVLETLAVIAYKQPVTRADIEAVRGVRCEYSMNQLLNLHLIEEVGRKQTIGRPALFATTDQFLQLFGLSKIEELPEKQNFDENGKESEGTMPV